MMKKSKTLLWVLTFALVLSLAAGSTVTAFAATKETAITSVLIDASEGELWEMDWELTGDDTAAYTINNKGTYLAYNQASLYGLSLVCGTPVPVSADKVEVEWDIVGINEVGYDTYWVPYAWCTDFTMTDANLAAFFYCNPTRTDLPQLLANTHYKMEYTKADSGATTVKLYSATVKADGKYADTDYTEKTHGFTAPAWPTDDREYFFGFMGRSNGDGSIELDNFSLKAGTVNFICDFEDNGKYAQGQLSGASSNHVDVIKNKLAVTLANTVQVCEYNVVNPAEDNRLVLADKSKAIILDEKSDKCAQVTASLRLDEVSGNDKVGISFGLAEKDQTVTAEKTSFVYLYNVTEDTTTTTYANVLNGGTAGVTPISLGADYTGKFVELTLDVATSGATAVSVDGTPLSGTLQVDNIAGLVAVDHIGDEGIKYSVGKNLSIKNYSYLGGSGGNVAVNFNTDYVNEDNFVYSFDGKAAQLEDATKAEGVKIEDGALFFKGSSDGDYIGSKETYADFILEFTYTNLVESERPATTAQKGENSNGAYSPLIIQMSATQLGYNGAPVTGDKICFYDGSIYAGITGGTMGTFMQYEPHKSGGDTARVVLESGCTADSAAGSTPATGLVGLYGKTSQIKVVCANGKVKVYAFNVVEGQTHTGDDYVLLGTFDIKNAFGYVGIATTESGYFKIDNLRITNVDAKTEEEVNAKIAAYADMQPIPNEYKLATPKVKLTDNVATWEAVENATGYELTLGDGEPKKVGADVLSYTFTETEPGDYVLSVRALYEGEENIRNSNAKSVTYKVAAPTVPDDNKDNNGDKEPNKDKNDGKGETGCGCGSTAGAAASGASIVVLIACAVIFCLRRKHTEKNS